MKRRMVIAVFGVLLLIGGFICLPRLKLLLVASSGKAAVASGFSQYHSVSEERLPREKHRRGKIVDGNVMDDGRHVRTMRVETAQLGNKAKVPTRSRMAIPDDSSLLLKAIQPGDTSVQKLAQAASDKNQVMDELLNQEQIPADYGLKMVELFRDADQDELTRDFAVQHIGLYAQTLQRRGAYDPASAEARTLRTALDEAAADTNSIIAAAAFRALADMAAFDPHVDARRLDSRLAACVGDTAAAPAARVMSAHLCGERRIADARATLSSLADAPSTPTPLRLASRHALGALPKEVPR